MAKGNYQNDVAKDISRQKIVDETQLFLAAGGKITTIPSGRSGIDRPESVLKHIKLGKQKQLQRWLKLQILPVCFFGNGSCMDKYFTTPANGFGQLHSTPLWITAEFKVAD